MLGSPDNQALGNEADAYEELLEPIKPLAISDTKGKGRAWLFSLERQWLPCTYKVFNDGPLWLSSKEKARGGMSGSPVLLGNGKAIGVVSLGDDAPNPRLMRNLPGWLLK